MKTIQELLKASNSRVSSGSVWMYWDEFLDGWTVLEQNLYARKPKELYFGDEAGAVAAFAKATRLESEGV